MKALSRCLCFCLLSLFLWQDAGPLYAQAPPSPTPTPAAGSNFESRPPILQYLVAAAGIGLIIGILVVPTRKS